MKKTIHLILGILCIIPSLFAQTTFDTFFERKSLRLINFIMGVITSISMTKQQTN